MLVEYTLKKPKSCFASVDLLVLSIDSVVVLKSYNEFYFAKNAPCSIWSDCYGNSNVTLNSKKVISMYRLRPLLHTERNILKVVYIYRNSHWKLTNK